MSKPSIKIALHEPIAPYFASMYSTLVSIAQGLAIGGLFYIISEAFPTLSSITFWVYCKIFIVFLLICLIWHRYVSHFQYLAWRPSVFDAIISMGFAVLQSLLIVSIRESIFYFSLSLSLLFFLGFLVYLNVLIRHNNPQTLEVFKEHFAFINDEFAITLYDEITLFNRRARWQMIVISLVFAVIALLIHSFEFISENIYTLFITMLCLFVFIYLFRIDLPETFKRSERLKQYGFFSTDPLKPEQNQIFLLL